MKKQNTFSPDAYFTAERTALGMSQEMLALEAELDRSSMSVVSSAVNIT
jgi:DNA-binding XRE family transcriptional regulator